MTVLSMTLPLASITATLQPVLYAGSKPKITLFFSGGCIRSGFKLTSNILIACSLAISVRFERSSRTKEGKISLSKLSPMALSINSLYAPSFTSTSFEMSSRHLSLFVSTSTFKHSSFSPRLIASTLWLGILLTGSLKFSYV